MSKRSVKVCIVKGCQNESDQGMFVGKLCWPCYDFITTGRGVHSRAYKNALVAVADSLMDTLDEAHRR